MASNLVLILDDRATPPPDIEAVLGRARFSQILRRRRRLADEIADTVATVSDRTIPIEVITTPAEARDLVHRIESRGAGPLYLRMPSCIMPLRMGNFAALLDKAHYALESMLLSAIHDDEAVALLTAGDAATLLQAESADARRATILHIAERAPTMVDHLELVDLRRPRALLKFLSGSTEARHFNALRAETGILRKTSTDTAKMRAEHGLFHVAPEGLKRFLVPTFDFWESGDRAGYAMEHMAIPDVALQFIHGAFDPESYGLLLDQILAFLAARPPEGDGGDVRKAWEEQITGKLRSRMAAMLKTDTGRQLDAILRAAGPMGGLEAMLTRAEAILDRAARADASTALVFSHGDPCYSNILFDRRLGLMRLIDPRGAQAPRDALMHPLYDIAKVSHSALGGYDFINNYLFSCALGDGLQLRLMLGETGMARHDPEVVPVPDGPPDWAMAMFRAKLASAGHDIFVVRAVEVSLFLSMLPLHTDHPRKLAGFALVAARLIDELEETGPQ